MVDLAVMKERYESISLANLKDMAKFRGIKLTAGMKKADIIASMLEKDAEENREEAAGLNKKEAKPVKKAVVTSDDKPVKKSIKSADKKVKDESAKEVKPRTDKAKGDKTKEQPVKEVVAKDTDISVAEDRVANEKPVQENSKAHEAVEAPRKEEPEFNSELDSGKTASGILEVMSDGYGFIRCENFLPGDNDVYVAPGQIRKYSLRTGDILEGRLKIKGEKEKFAALLYINSVNGMTPEQSMKRFQFENMTPIFPNNRIKLAIPGAPVSMRIMDLLCPVGKGQRGMIVSPPKAGKTTLLKSVAKSVKVSNPDMHMIILLIDERPEEVTDIKEEVMGDNVEVIYSTFDETAEHHKRVAEMVIERARRLVEYNKDVIILLDSITRLTRAYNQVVPPSGRTLSGGLDPAALHMPKRFFGAARNMREGGSLTILATALVETGSKMDDVVYEEFKGTGNMEIVLDRKLSERRVFPAIDIPKSGTRRDDLLLTPDELSAINMIRRSFNDMQAGDSVDRVLDMFAKTRTNAEFVDLAMKMRF